MASISKNVYIDKLDDVVNKYNNTYHSITKMKPVNLKPSTNVGYSEEINSQDLKFKIRDNARISKYKNIFVKGYIKYFHATTRVFSWKSNGISEESIENINKSETSFVPTIVNHQLFPYMNFNRACFIKNNISIPRILINLYISYTLFPQLRNLNKGFSLANYIFGSAKMHLTKNADLHKYKYTNYGIGFDSRSEFSFTDGSYGKMSLFVELIWTHLCMLIIREKTS